jgi:predicted phage terminase large subunit-like protein
LMILIGPRHGKSTVGSKNFPAWYLGRHPSDQLITVSYGAEQANEFGREVRNTIDSHEYQKLFNVTLRQDSQAANRWHTNKNGVYIAAGIGGPITGRGANKILIDDPHKNRKEADSKQNSDAVWDFYKSTLYTRLMPGGAIILIMQRWNERDLAGRLIAEMKDGGDKWHIVELPAWSDDEGVATDDWEKGHALWPEWYGKESLQRIAKTIGTRNWASQYQQQPKSDEGTIVKRHWFGYWSNSGVPGSVPLPKRFDEVVQTWDLTFKKAEESSRVSGQVFGIVGANIYLLDEVCDSMSFVDTIRAFQAMTSKWPDAWRKLVEDKANGPALESVLKNKISGICMVNPEGDKPARLWSVTPAMESGNVYLPDPNMVGYDWVNAWLDEVCSFPNGKKDDRVDAFSQIMNYFGKAENNIFKALSKI